MQFTINQIATMLGGKVEGEATSTVNTIGTLENAEEGSISFLHNNKYENLIYSTRASAVIVGNDFAPRKVINTALIRVEDPYTSMTTLLEQYEKAKASLKVGVEQPSFIGESANVGENIYRGAFSYIGKDVRIGNNCKLYPNSYLGDNVTIGDNTVIFAGVKVYAGCTIGSNCVLHSGAVIGSDGFGFAPQSDGTYKGIPQLGNVIIEDNVSIGANTVVDCATLESTIIRKGAKLDNLIQVAHNVEIGENTVIAAQSGISGSSILGKNVIMGGQSAISGHVKIADRTTLAGQSGISKSIRKSDRVLFGTPAFDIKSYFKSYSVFKNLDQLTKRLKELEEKVLNLRPSSEK